MIRSFAILLGFQFTGETVVSAAGIPIPGNVIGMVLLTAALASGAVRPDWIEPAADFLVENLALLFVPAGVGVIAYTGLIGREWLPIGVSILISLILVLVVTGKAYQLFSRRNDRRNDA